MVSEKRRQYMRDYRKIYYKVRPTESPLDKGELGLPVLRRFYCAHCSKLVEVWKKKDKRVKYCCSMCEKNHNKHTGRGKKREN